MILSYKNKLFHNNYLLVIFIFFDIFFLFDELRHLIHIKNSFRRLYKLKTFLNEKSIYFSKKKSYLFYAFQK